MKGPNRSPKLFRSRVMTALLVWCLWVLLLLGKPCNILYVQVWLGECLIKFNFHIIYEEVPTNHMMACGIFRPETINLHVIWPSHRIDLLILVTPCFVTQGANAGSEILASPVVSVECILEEVELRVRRLEKLQMINTVSFWRLF